MYLRRDHVEAIIETWRELGGHAGFKEVVAGVAGAFVRVYTKSAESTVSGTYQLQRVCAAASMRRGKLPSHLLPSSSLEALISIDSQNRGAGARLEKEGL